MHTSSLARGLSGLLVPGGVGRHLRSVAELERYVALAELEDALRTTGSAAVVRLKPTGERSHRPRLLGLQRSAIRWLGVLAVKPPRGLTALLGHGQSVTPCSSAGPNASCRLPGGWATVR